MDAPNIPAGETGEIKIALPFYGVGEYVLTESLCLKENQLWAASGFEIAFGQTVFKKSESTSDITAWLDKKNFYQPVTPFEFSALPNSPHEFENARHQEELPPHKFTFVKINSEQIGVAEMTVGKCLL